MRLWTFKRDVTIGVLSVKFGEVLFDYISFEYSKVMVGAMEGSGHGLL
jgi:hypothetical protein